MRVSIRDLKSKSAASTAVSGSEEVFNITPSLSFDPAVDHIVGTTPLRDSTIRGSGILSPESDDAWNPCKPIERSGMQGQHPPRNQNTGIPRLKNSTLR